MFWYLKPKTLKTDVQNNIKNKEITLNVKWTSPADDVATTS